MATESGSIAAPLEGLTADQKRFINDQLSNNQESSDEEFAEHLIEELSLTQEQVDLIVGCRARAMTDMGFELFPGFYY